MAKSDDQPRKTVVRARIRPEVVRQTMAAGHGLVIPIENFVADSPGGTGDLVLGAPPRNWPTDKAEREVAVARLLAAVLQRQFPAAPPLEDLRPGGDPPDVVGTFDGAPIGLELGEIRDGKRTSGRVALDQLRARILERLGLRRTQIGTLGFLVTFRDPLAARQQLPKGRHGERLVEGIANAMVQCAGGTRAAILPPPLRAVSCFGYSPRADGPWLVFDAELDPVVPASAAEVTRRIAARKLQVDTSEGTQMLVLWSESSTFRAVFPLVAAQVAQVIADTEASTPYDFVALLECRLFDGEQAFVLPGRASR